MVCCACLLCIWRCLSLCLSPCPSCSALCVCIWKLFIMYTLCTVCCVPSPLSLSLCTYCIQMTSGILGAIIEWKRIILCELIALVTFNLTPAPRARTRSRNSAAKRQLSHTKSKSKGNRTEKNRADFPYSFYLPPSLPLPLFLYHSPYFILVSASISFLV